MKIEKITERDDLVIRRTILEPQEATRWHTDSCHRFSVVVRGAKLAIEYKDSGEIMEFDAEGSFTNLLIQLIAKPIANSSIAFFQQI